MAAPDDLHLHPARGTALRWGLAATVLIAAAGWLVADSRGHPLAVLLLVVSVVAAAPVLVQLVAPHRWSLRLDDHGVHATVGWWRAEVAWEDVVLVRVRRLVGDPVLDLTHRQGRLLVPLPLGADLAALHRSLAARLGPTPPSPTSRR